VSSDLNGSFPGCGISLKNPMFKGIIGGVDIEFDIKNLPATLPGILEFRWLGKSTIVKVTFESETFLKHYIVHWIKFCYQLFRVEKDRVIPKAVLNVKVIDKRSVLFIVINLD